ncbi:hypothetical protein [Lentzea sp. E54]|uniref:hypothetical protein n=1 Tax=Lentzea xerophila TaxID=3435883 RepID=UPI003DA23CA6
MDSIDWLCEMLLIRAQLPADAAIRLLHELAAVLEEHRNQEVHDGSLEEFVLRDLENFEGGKHLRLVTVIFDLVKEAGITPDDLLDSLYQTTEEEWAEYFFAQFVRTCWTDVEPQPELWDTQAAAFVRVAEIMGLAGKATQLMSDLQNFPYRKRLEILNRTYNVSIPALSRAPEEEPKPPRSRMPRLPG